jgi:MFS family permease
VKSEGWRSNDRIVFVVVLASAYVVAVGYSVVLPFLPGLVGRAADAGDAAARARTVGGLVAAFSAAALMLSPAWGWLSDRWGRRPVLLLGMTGFAATLALSAWDDSLWRLYLYRGLNGAFSAAVTPVAFAFVADRSADDLDRARRFAWLNALVLAGYLTGPLVGELAARIGPAVPLLGPAAIVGLCAGLAAVALPRSREGTHMATPPRARAGGHLAGLLVIAAVAAGGIAALEVVLALAPESRGLSRSSVSLLLSLCGLAMFAAQILQITGRRVAAGGSRLFRSALVILALALAAAAMAKGPWALAALVAVAAWSAATLGLVTNYLVSELSPGRQGTGLGLQYAAANAGQIVGPVAAGWTPGGGALVLWSAAALSFVLALGQWRSGRSLRTTPGAT